MAVGLDDGLEGRDGLGHLLVLHAGLAGLGHLELALVEGLALHLPLGLQGGHDILVLPPDLRRGQAWRNGLGFGNRFRLFRKEYSSTR